MCCVAVTLITFLTLAHASDTDRVRRGLLGVKVTDNTPEIRQTLDIKIKAGVIVMEVLKGSPADMAGLQKRDIITHVSSVVISDGPQLSATISVVEPGDTVLIRFIRGGKIFQRKVTVAEAPPGSSTPHKKIYKSPTQAVIKEKLKTSVEFYEEKDSGAIDLLDQKADGPIRNTYDETFEKK